MNRNDPLIVDRLSARFERVTTVSAVDQPTVLVPKDDVLPVLRHLKDGEGYRLFLDVAAVDYLPKIPRFELVYHLYHPEKAARIRVRCQLGEDETMPSVTGIWAGANWPEREAYDLFGIRFEGHPDLKRIYLPDDWEGHPLRKDYPVTGNRVD